MPNMRLIPLNGNAGATVEIVATIPSRRIELIEDEATTPQGVAFKTLMDGFTNTRSVGILRQPFVIVGSASFNNGKGPILGYPAYNSGGSSRQADKIVKGAISLTATPTTLVVTEYE